MSGSMIPERDNSGRAIVRVASTEDGWSMLGYYATLKLGLYTNYFYCKDLLGNDCNVVAYHYDSNDTLLTSQAQVTASCVMTDFVFQFGYDIDLDSGWVTQGSSPVNDIYVWGAFGAINNGSIVNVKEFIRCLNLKHLKNDHYIDGKSSKKLINDLGLGFEANQGLIRVRHGIGETHQFQLNIGYYRA